MCVSACMCAYMYFGPGKSFYFQPISIIGPLNNLSSMEMLLKKSSLVMDLFQENRLYVKYN